MVIEIDDLHWFTYIYLLKMVMFDSYVRLTSDFLGFPVSFLIIQASGKSTRLGIFSSSLSGQPMPKPLILPCYNMSR